MHQQNPVDAPPESRGTTRIRRTPTESCLHLQRVDGPVELVHTRSLFCDKDYVQSHGIFDFAMSITCSFY